jgi:hypothetical protein
MSGKKRPSTRLKGHKFPKPPFLGVSIVYFEYEQQSSSRRSHQGDKGDRGKFFFTQTLNWPYVLLHKSKLCLVTV